MEFLNLLEKTLGKEAVTRVPSSLRDMIFLLETSNFWQGKRENRIKFLQVSLHQMNERKLQQLHCQSCVKEYRYLYVLVEKAKSPIE